MSWWNNFLDWMFEAGKKVWCWFVDMCVAWVWKWIEPWLNLLPDNTGLGTPALTQMSEWYGAFASFLPLNFTVGLTLTYYGIVLGWKTIQFIKSFIPTE